MQLLVLSSVLILAIFCDNERIEDGPVSPHGKKRENEIKLEVNAGRESVQKFAENLDLNKDGFVDLEELQDWVAGAYKLDDHKEAVERLSEMDVNGDGYLTWVEYKEDSFPPDEYSNSNEEQRLMQQDRNFFEASDLNHDGKLDLEEFTAFISPESHPHMHETLVKNTLMERDTNGDGGLGIDEFLGDAEEYQGNDWYKLEQKKFETEYDFNKDGILTGEELRQWLIPDTSILGNSEATHLLANSDDDEDGKLSYDEILAHHKLFAKSTAAIDGHLHPYDHDEL